jgi:hypothetical protein
MRGIQRLIRHLRHLAVDLERRRKISRDKKIGTVLAEHQAQQVVHEFGSLIAFHDLPWFKNLTT